MLNGSYQSVQTSDQGNHNCVLMEDYLTSDSSPVHLNAPSINCTRERPTLYQTSASHGMYLSSPRSLHSNHEAINDSRNHANSHDGRWEISPVVHEGVSESSLPHENSLIPVCQIHPESTSNMSKSMVFHEFHTQRPPEQFKCWKHFPSTTHSRHLVVERRVHKPSHHPDMKYQPKIIDILQSYLPWYRNSKGSGPWCSAQADEVPYQNWFIEFRGRCMNVEDCTFMAIRFFISFLVILGLFVVNIVLEADVTPPGAIRTEKPVIWDFLHEHSHAFNNALLDSQLLLSLLLMVSSFLMDMVVFIVWLQWSILGQSFRLPIVYFLFYMCKFLFKLICILPYPVGYVWRVPRFNSVEVKSLTVPYIGSADFFYSGHIGCCMLSFLEHYSYRCYVGCAFSLFVLVVEFTAMIGTRGHYTIDMLTGIVFAHWFHIMSTRISRYVDQWFALPLRPTITLEKVQKDSEDLSNVTPELPTQRLSVTRNF